MRVLEDRVDGIPVLLVHSHVTTGPLALWITHLGGNASKELPTLERLATAGIPAVSFDPPGHGARGDGGDPWAMAHHVLHHFRRQMWPLLGATTLEAMGVLTWALEALGRDPGAGVVAGGVSMGGDIAIALAGADSRVRRVATIGSTPDWERPDMRDLADPDLVVRQGEPHPQGQWYADRLDPMRHVETYPFVPISFELGGDDRHIPAANAVAFRDRLVARDPAFADLVRVTTHSGLDHLGVTTDEGAVDAACAWLSATEPTDVR